MIDDYLNQLDGEEIDKQKHNGEIQDNIKALKLVTKAFNKGRKIKPEHQWIANTIRESHKTYSNDKTNIMTTDIPEKAGDIEDMDDQSPEIGDLYYMSDQGPGSTSSYTITDEDIEEMLKHDKNIQSLLLGEAEIKKISGDDDEEEEGEYDEGTTTIAAEGDQEFGTITFPFSYDLRSVIPRFFSAIKCTNDAEVSNKVKKQSYKFIINKLEEKKAKEKNKISMLSKESEKYIKGKANIEKAEEYIDRATHAMDNLNLKTGAKEEPKKEAVKYISPTSIRRTKKSTQG
jgi:hypothetical protein